MKTAHIEPLIESVVVAMTHQKIIGKISYYSLKPRSLNDIYEDIADAKKDYPQSDMIQSGGITVSF